ncbi:MAG: SRPBCC family protein [Pyrinomonadaceae bacterium]
MIKKVLIGLVVAVVLLLAIFFAPAFLVPVVTNETRVTINKPREEVWKKFMDSSQMGKWLVGFKSIETISGEPDKVGSKHKIVLEENGQRFEATETVKEVVENEKFAFELAADAIRDDITVTLINKGLTTEVVQSERVTADGVFYRAMCFWMKSWMRERSQQNMDNLKKYIEEE